MCAHLCNLAPDEEAIVQRVQLLTLRQLVGRTDLCSSAQVQCFRCALRDRIYFLLFHHSDHGPARANAKLSQSRKSILTLATKAFKLPANVCQQPTISPMHRILRRHARTRQSSGTA